MAQPFEPIPDSTQVHVDRLLGATVDGYRVLARAGEGRRGTRYAARELAADREVTLEVLRSELVGNDDDARAANAIGCGGIANVLAFGHVPDGRRYRVMEPLPRESLDQLVQRRGALPPREVSRLLDEVAVVLEASHAWTIVHGSLGLTSVLVGEGGVKVIDFALAKQKLTEEDDLHALGALGLSLLAGHEVPEEALSSAGRGAWKELERLLKDLLERRIVSATAFRKELALLDDTLAARRREGASSSRSLRPVGAARTQPAAPQRTPAGAAGVPAADGRAGAPGVAASVTEARTSRGPVVVAVVVVALVAMGGAAAMLFFPTEAPPLPTPVEPPVTVAAPVAPVEVPATLDAGAALEATAPVDAGAPVEVATPVTPVERRPTTAPVRTPRSVPSAQALSQLTSKLEAQLRKQARPGDDVEQALFVLNKQRLRLSGSPTLEDREAVAKQLADWKKSYLRR